MSLNNLTLIEPGAVSKAMKIKMKFPDTLLAFGLVTIYLTEFFSLLNANQTCLTSGRLATLTCPPFGGNSFCLIAGIKTGYNKSI